MFKLLLGAICIGFAPIFVKKIALGPTPIGMYRCGLAALFLFFYILGFSKSKMSPMTWPWKVWRLLILAGLLFGLDLFVWHRSVVYAGAGIGTILGNTQVFYVGLVGILFYKDKLTPIFLCSVLLATLGIFLISSNEAHTELKPDYRIGIFFGLATGVVYASYILTMRQIESYNSTIRTEQALAIVSLIACLSLIPISGVEGTLILPSLEQWILLASLALVAQVLGWMLITRNLSKTPVSRAGLVLNAQPVVAVVAGSLILGERLSLLQLCGALLTLVAIYLGTRGVKRVKTK